MPRKSPPDSSPADAGINRRLSFVTYGCSLAAGIGLLYLSLGRSGGWTLAWVPLGTGVCLALASVGGLILRARQRRRPVAPESRSIVPNASFSSSDVWREIDSNRDLLYALLELSRRRMRDTVSHPATPPSRPPQ